MSLFGFYLAQIKKHFVIALPADSSDHLCFEVKQPAELHKLTLVITVEKDLVEAWETQDRLVAVKLHPDRDDTSPGRQTM